MLHLMWSFMVLFSVIFSVVRGNSGELFARAIAGAEGAIQLTLRLAAGYGFFCGLIGVLKGLGAPQFLSRALSPLLRRLFPAVRREETRQAIAMNFTANLLGLGNAATPMGIQAMRRMNDEGKENSEIFDSICLFLVVNATSLQLIPTTVLTLRAAAGSVSPESVVLPTLACTALSTLVGVTAAKLCARFRRHGQ